MPNLQQSLRSLGQSVGSRAYFFLVATIWKLSARNLQIKIHEKISAQSAHYPNRERGADGVGECELSTVTDGLQEERYASGSPFDEAVAGPAQEGLERRPPARDYPPPPPSYPFPPRLAPYPSDMSSEWPPLDRRHNQSYLDALHESSNHSQSLSAYSSTISGLTSTASGNPGLPPAHPSAHGIGTSFRRYHSATPTIGRDGGTASPSSDADASAHGRHSGTPSFPYSHSTTSPSAPAFGPNPYPSTSFHTHIHAVNALQADPYRAQTGASTFPSSPTAWAAYEDPEVGSTLAVASRTQYLEVRGSLSSAGATESRRVEAGVESEDE